VVSKRGGRIGKKIISKGVVVGGGVDVDVEMKEKE
jgi:hypothetical protein